MDAKNSYILEFSLTMYQILVIFVLKWAERSSQHRERFTGERFTSVPQISGGEAQKTIVSYSSLCQHTCQSKQPHLTHYIPNSFMVLGSKHAFFNEAKFRCFNKGVYGH